MEGAQLKVNDAGTEEVAPPARADELYVISNLEAAHRQLATAIRLYVEGGDIVAVHTLACAAREIYEKHCKAIGQRRFFDILADSFPDRTEKQIWDRLNLARNFFKHPAGTGDYNETIELSQRDNRYMLFIAAHDCAMLVGDVDMPAIARYYFAWFCSTDPMFATANKHSLHEHFPDFYHLTPQEQRLALKGVLMHFKAW